MTGTKYTIPEEALQEIHDFLGCDTPDSWVKNALEHEEVMLVDHAHCEKKAAMTALNLIHQYPEDTELLNKMSRLAREELRHFEQVLKFIKQRKLRYRQLSASRYASGLRDHMRKQGADKLVDVLIIGAFIEARSCERFAKLAPYLKEDLQEFYISLLKSEARHYQDYLKLAAKYADDALDERVDYFRAIERDLIESPDKAFRFHSGPIIS